MNKENSQKELYAKIAKSLGIRKEFFIDPKQPTEIEVRVIHRDLYNNQTQDRS